MRARREFWSERRELPRGCARGCRSRSPRRRAGAAGRLRSGPSSEICSDAPKSCNGSAAIGVARPSTRRDENRDFGTCHRKPGAGNVARSRWCDTRRRRSEPTGNTNFDLNRRAQSPTLLMSGEGKRSDCRRLKPPRPSSTLPTGSDARAHLPAHGRDHRDLCLTLHLLRKRSSSRNAGADVYATTLRSIRRCSGSNLPPIRKDRSTLPIENQSFVSGGEGVFMPPFSFPGFDSIPGVILAKHRPKFPTALRGLLAKPLLKQDR